MYTLAKKDFGDKIMELVVSGKYISVYGKAYDRMQTCRPGPTLIDLVRIPSFLIKEISLRAKFYAPPAEPMSAQLKSFCVETWKAAAEKNSFYNRK